MPSTSCVLTSRAKDTEGVGASPARATSASPRVSPRVSSTMYGNVHLPLVGLDSAGTEAALLHLARAEGCRSLEPRLLKFLHERSGGNPWHAKEWLLDCMKHELIVVQGEVQGEDQAIDTSLLTSIGMASTIRETTSMASTIRETTSTASTIRETTSMASTIRETTSMQVGEMHIKVGYRPNLILLSCEFVDPPAIIYSGYAYRLLVTNVVP